MDPVNTEKLDRLLKLAEENNALLLKMHKSQKTSRLFRILYWVIIILVTVVGFYAFMPLLSNLGSVYGVNSASDVNSDIQNANSQQMQDLLKSLQ